MKILSTPTQWGLLDYKSTLRVKATQGLPAAFKMHAGELQNLSTGETSLSSAFNTIKHTSNTMQTTNNNTVVAMNVFR